MLLLSLLLACTSPKSDDTGAADTSIGDTDTAADTDTDTDTDTDVHSVACDGAILDPADAAPITLDWTAYMPLVRIDAMVMAGPASTAKELACAGDIDQADIEQMFSHDPARDGELSSGTVDLTEHAGDALTILLRDDAGETAWYLDIQAGGATVLTLE